jgi:hypothetical protein
MLLLILKFKDTFRLLIEMLEDAFKPQTIDGFREEDFKDDEKTQ